jgi:beta-lactamase class D
VAPSAGTTESRGRGIRQRWKHNEKKLAPVSGESITNAVAMNCIRTVRLLRTFLCFLLLSWPLARGAETDLKVVPALGEAFAQRNLPGVFVAFDTRSGTWSTNDPVRAAVRFLPASTFKIPNSLIALEVGAVASVDTVLKWDGVKRDLVPGWNCDQSMREALPRSTVWFYQELARRTGEKRMAEWVRRIGYGNADIGGGIDVFWLQGALRISAVEQIRFLRALRDDTLPFRVEVRKTVKELLVCHRGDGWVLRAKTGWTARVKNPVGWYVGWVELADGAVFFATNVDARTWSESPLRVAISYENLVRLGALPAGTVPPK